MKVACRDESYWELQLLGWVPRTLYSDDDQLGRLRSLDSASEY
jgi:hypothetical protein